jgi:hypothetical protein
MLGAIESLLSAVVADGMARTRHDPDAELLAQGFGNILCPFFGGIPATGAIARTATNIRSGGRSPVAAMIHALTVLLAVLALAPLIGYLPMCSLAALLLLVAWNMSEARHFVQMLRTAPKSDVAVLLTCFTLTVAFDMVVAVAVGIVLAALLFMRRMAEVTHTQLKIGAHPDLKVPLPDGVLLYDINGPLFFGAAQLRGFFLNQSFPLAPFLFEGERTASFYLSLGDDPMRTLFRIFPLLIALTASPLLACDHCGCDQTAAEGGFGTILTPSAGTLKRGAVTLSLNGEFTQYESWDPYATAALVDSGVDTHDRIHDHQANLSLSVGVTRNLTLTATLNEVSKRDFELEDSDRIGQRQTSSGFGDAALQAKFRFYEGSWDWALLAGVKFPTGRTSERTPGGDLYETELQPGSGSTDFNLGMATTHHVTPRTTFNAAFSFTRHGDGGTQVQEYRFGNLMQIRAGFAHAFTDSESSHGVAGTLEIVALHSGRDRADGATDPNSGTKFALFLAPGISVRLASWSTFYLSVPLAIADNPYGIHQKTRFEVLGGITFRFN